MPTPGLTTIAEVAGSLHLPSGALLKAFPVIAEGRGLVLVVVRGDHQVNDIKLTNALGATFRPAREDEFAQRIGPAGSMGPVGADVPVLLDDAVSPGPYVTGANREGRHLRGVEPGRDFPFKRGDVRKVEAGTRSAARRSASSRRSRSATSSSSAPASPSRSAPPTSTSRAAASS